MIKARACMLPKPVNGTHNVWTLSKATLPDPHFHLNDLGPYGQRKNLSPGNCLFLKLNSSSPTSDIADHSDMSAMPI